MRKQDVPVLLTGAAAVLPVISIAGFEIALGAAIVAMAVLRVKPRWPPIWLPLSLFFLGTVISWLASGDLRGGLPQIRKFYVYAMVFVVASVFQNVRQIRWLALAWAAAATASAGLGLYQFYDKYEDAVEKHQNFYEAYVADRITGFLDHWMTFSGEMMMALLIIGSVVFFCRDRRWIAWLVAAGVVIGAALVAAETRSMWAGAACGGIYLLWLWKRWTVIALPVVAAILMLVNPFGIGERERSIFQPHGDKDSNAHRSVTRRIGWAMIKAHPLLGVGPEQVGKQYRSYVPADVTKLPTGYYQHLHNVYIHYAAERGVPTMLMLVWMLLRALYDFARTLRRMPSGDESRWVLEMAIAVTIAIMIAAWEEVNLGTSVVLAMFLAVVGCGYVVVFNARELQPSPTSDQP
ncbi:MAG TPA: O-antigen ligase family protein [Bryobacteraceae bacterium]|nr:O-antigen ligase family protein [Bryobacteraceae bacterium]